MIRRFFSEHAFQKANAVETSDMLEKSVSRSDDIVMSNEFVG